MAVILRIDVDRPYGRQPFLRHVLSRLSSDFYCPRIEEFGYLRELKEILEMLKARDSRAYIFMRRCTSPSEPVRRLITEGRHAVGLHLENSRSFETFVAEKSSLERTIGRPVLALSKHGSGKGKYGFHHYAPYEPDKYVSWAHRTGMKLFFGNAEDPSITGSRDNGGFQVFPSAFWLEPPWRDTNRFSVDWLIEKGRSSDIVLLIHPENVLADATLMKDFQRILRSTETRLIQ